MRPENNSHQQDTAARVSAPCLNLNTRSRVIPELSQVSTQPHHNFTRWLVRGVTFYQRTS